MKKLLAIGCCFLFLNDFTKASPESTTDQKTSGKKILVKAIAVIVNTESNKKLPARQTFIAPSAPPKF